MENGLRIFWVSLQVASNTSWMNIREALKRKYLPMDMSYLKRFPVDQWHMWFKLDGQLDEKSVLSFTRPSSSGGIPYTMIYSVVYRCVMYTVM